MYHDINRKTYVVANAFLINTQHNKLVDTIANKAGSAMDTNSTLTEVQYRRVT